MTLYEWAKRRGACADGLAWVRGRKATVRTWLAMGGSWRLWLARALQVAPCNLDVVYTTTCVGHDECPWCRLFRRVLNRPANYAALVRHWHDVVLPALRKAGVR